MNTRAMRMHMVTVKAASTKSWSKWMLISDRSLVVIRLNSSWIKPEKV